MPRPRFAGGILVVIVMAAAACGGSDSAQRVTVAQTMTAEASQAVDQELAGLAARLDEGTAQNRSLLRQAGAPDGVGPTSLAPSSPPKGVFANSMFQRIERLNSMH